MAKFDSEAKIFLILYPPLENSTTHITIMINRLLPHFKMEISPLQSFDLCSYSKPQYVVVTQPPRVSPTTPQIVYIRETPYTKAPLHQYKQGSFKPFIPQPKYQPHPHPHPHLQPNPNPHPPPQPVYHPIPHPPVSSREK